MPRYMTIDTRPGIGYAGLVAVLNTKAKLGWELSWLTEMTDPATSGVFYRLILKRVS